MSERGIKVRLVGALTGSSASVSVSPAPNCPGVVLILFGPFISLPPNNLVLKLALVTLGTLPLPIELEPSPPRLNVNIAVSESSSSSPLSICGCCNFCIVEGYAWGGLCNRGDDADFLGGLLVVGILAGVKKTREPKFPPNSVDEEREGGLLLLVCLGVDVVCSSGGVLGSDFE